MTGLSSLLMATLLVVGAGPSQTADGMETVRQFYAAADYESALAALEKLSPEAAPTEEIEIRRYRALCLMALGRPADAERVIEQVLAIDPSYQPDEQEAPRVRSAYASVRARVVPQVARASYADAKAAYDRRDYGTATAGFTRTIALLDLLESADPALGDLRTLASGFLDLGRAAATPAVPAAPPEPVATPVAADAPVAPSPAAATPPADAPAASPPVATRPDAVPPPAPDVPATPPVVIAQALPPWNPAAFGTQFQSEFRGAIEVTIDERGIVTTAKIVEPVHPAYDLQLLEAAKAWRYDPARREGKPVVSIKRVDIVLRPR